MSLEKIKEAKSIDPNDVNVAFRLEYKDNVFNLDTALKSVQSFVHDAVLAATRAPHEAIQEIQVTVTFNNPKTGSTKLVVAKEGDARSPEELGFKGR